MNVHEPDRTGPSDGSTTSGSTASTPDTSGTFGWAVLGAGSIARRFVGQLPRSTEGRLVAVGSRDPERAATWVRDQGLDAHDVHTGDYDQILADPAVDGVYVAAVHTAHADLVLRALAAGKHVLCEKPLAVNHGTAMALVDAARQRGLGLIEAYMYRFHPQTRRLLELVADGAIGELSHVDASFSFDTGPQHTGRLFDPDTAGGGILDVGGYPVSIVRAIAGAASGRPVAEPTTVEARGTLDPLGVDTWAVADLRFAGGLSAHVRTGVQVTDHNTVTVYGSKGFIELTDPWTLSENPELRLVVAGEESETIGFGDAAPYALEADALVRLARGGDVSTGAPEMSLLDSLGNAVVSDDWREQIGLRYPFERDDADIPTLSGPRVGADLHRDEQNPMRYGRIEGLDHDVSRLIMGVDNQPNLAHASALFDHFFSVGGNAFDTAYIYGGGKLEGLLGRWITNRGIRDQVVVITKGAHTPHCDPESLSRQLLESLERQGTDYADVYMMHRDNLEVPVGEFVDVLHEHAEAGRIRVYGGSNWSPERVDEANAYAAANRRRPFTVLSNHFGLAQAYDVPWDGCRHVTDPESKRWLAERRIALLPWSSQARGFFTGRARPDDTSDAELVRCYYSDDNFERLHRAEQLATEFGVAPTAIALAFVLAQPFPTFPLFGPRSIAECRSSMAGLGVELSPEQVAWLDLAD